MVTYRQHMCAPKPDQQLHHLAMLKLVLQMKRQPDASFETLSQDIAASMKLDTLAFQRFLVHYMPAFARQAAPAIR